MFQCTITGGGGGVAVLVTLLGFFAGVRYLVSFCIGGGEGQDKDFLGRGYVYMHYLLQGGGVVFLAPSQYLKGVGVIIN